MSPPIEGLPIIEGYRCTISGCNHLCASEKRMRRHWNENHEDIKHPFLEENLRKARLQTFFRGTKIRYFEVDSSATIDGANIASLVIATENDDGFKNESHMDVEYTETSHPQSSTMSHITTAPAAPCRVPPVDLNLDTLLYFHQFITQTSLTLPMLNRAESTVHYWQTEVVSLALRQRWLMCGVLALSAFHLAVFSDGMATEGAHRERAAAFCVEFTKEWEKATKRDMGLVDKETEIAGQHLQRLLRITSLTSKGVMQRISPESTGYSRLQVLIADIGSLVPSGSVPDPDGIRYAHDDTPTEGVNHSTTSKSDQDTLARHLNRLRALPARLTAALGPPEPDHLEEVLHTLTAIAVLIECSETSFASEDALENNTDNQARDWETVSRAAWEGMSMWLTKVSPSFYESIWRDNPASLVVLAHWALLVGRAERRGYWFLSGAAAMIVDEVKDRLEKEDEAMQSLIGDLL
ncbi:hypothetical protein N0V83_000360 [Neocucurbitaria cava]|uniref:C2H2-type domain-containing protein n=1 Tax=Neocucurbitaria cava TaxID=798079 RepID=A0A9W8YJ99_9PLEO|nr:hypothetical protein N0V83_000360 [Neocucurbitaria cava]